VDEPKKPTLDDRLVEARAAKAERDAKREEATKLRELLVLDLEAKLDAELGPRGREFEIVEFEQLDKVIAVKRPDPVLAKQMRKAQEKKHGATHEDHVDYVRKHVVYPPPSEATDLWRWFGEHQAAVYELALALMKLEGVRLDEKGGKV